ncbi:hypothetical protein K490DRAFT_60517 [Saccharata proteae CBS 121410]|uniref:Uncharacterized protein n=1 Tax=Saccharata proteae CBS 121410 TaxID=1314787 RepID=A0A9P4LRC0_9PEZI|nr:hypothetical protein K490DRAFT_60517 [Saccharata proteae CBS 121410]
MRFSTLSALVIVPAATMALPGQYLSGSAFEPFPMMELKRSANEGVHEKRSDGFAPLPTGTPTVPSYPTLAVTAEEGIFDKRFEDEVDAIAYESGHGKRDVSYPTAYVKRSEASGYVRRSEPSGYVRRSEPSGYVRRSEPSGYVRRSEPSGYVKRSEPTGYVRRSEPTGYVKRAEPTGYVKRADPTGFVTKRSTPTGYVKREANVEHEEQNAHINREELIKRYYPTGYLKGRQYGPYAPAPTGGSFPGLKLGLDEGVAEKRV